MPTYYVTTGGSDVNDGSIGAPWEHIPGTAAYTGGVTPTTGDTIYIASQGTWVLSSGSYGLNALAGVTYDGSSWGSGVKATIQANSAFGIAMVGVYQSNVTIRGIIVDVNSKNMTGLTVNWNAASANISNVAIRNCEIKNVGGTDGFYYGLLMGADGGHTTTGVTFDGNIVHHTAHEGLLIYPSDSPGTNQVLSATITNNEVYSTGQTDVSFGAGMLLKNYITGAVISGNNLHDNTHGIQFETGNVSGNPQTGLVIRNNIFHDNLRWGIYFTNGGVAMDADIYSNLFYDNGKAGQPEGGPMFFTGTNQGSATYDIYNNTIYSVNVAATSNYGVIVTTGASGTPTITFKNNIVYVANVVAIDDRKNWFTHSNNLAWRTSGSGDTVAYNGSTNYNRAAYTTYEASGVSADPLFTSPTSNFTLQGGSPAINAGVNVGLPYYGAAPDIGFFETGAPAVPTPPSGLRVTFV